MSAQAYPTVNTKILLAARPEGLPDPEKTFKIVQEPVPKAADLPDGHVLVRTVYLSLDPAMRGWMRDVRSYVPPVPLNDVMRGHAVGEVIASKNPRFRVGDKVGGMLGWQAYPLSDGRGLEKLVMPKGVTSLKTMIGLLGGTGMTAFFGFFDVGKPRAGQTVVVSGAAGATGMTVGQLAKIAGCRVIGIAGGPEKCRMLTEQLGFDVAVDYKSPSFRKDMVKATPKLVDVFFDNVGGDVLDVVLSRIAQNGTIVVCGGVSQYNESVPKGPTNYLALISQRATMRGFIVFDYEKQYKMAREQMGEWFAQGRLKAVEDVVQGLENAPRALLHLFEGKNTGKLMVQIAPESEPAAAKSKL